MEENDGSGMDPPQQLFKGLLSGWLLILIPVHIRETPEIGAIPQLLSHP